MLPIPPSASNAKLVIKTVLVTVVAVLAFIAGYYAANMVKPPPPPPTIFGEPVVMRTKGGLLEVTKVVSIESITQNFPGLFWDRTVTISVPATYRYHVELAPEWKFVRQDKYKTFVVVAPPIKPSKPVAINTAGMTINTNLPFGESDKNEAVRQITPLLDQKFLAYMARQREDARKTIAEFVKKWVLDQAKWNDAKDYRVMVLFPDESVNETLKVGLYPVLLPSDLPPPKND